MTRSQVFIMDTRINTLVILALGATLIIMYALYQYYGVYTR